MNLYVTPHHIREALRLDTPNSMPVERLESILEETCRYIDDELGRWFYVLNGTRYYDGVGSAEWWLPDDVISIETLKWDEDEDGDFETSLVEGTDFRGWPYNEGHYRRLDVVTARSSQLSGWPDQKRGLELKGKFGFAEETEDTGSTVASEQSASATTLEVSSGATHERGHTLLVGSEQQYVNDVVGSTLTVTRGVNGTTPAVHSSAASISRYTYPPALRSAITMEAVRWYREMSTGFAGAVASFNDAGFASFRATWPAILARLGPLRRADVVLSVGF